MSQLSPRWEQDSADYSYTLVDHFDGFYRVSSVYHDGTRLWTFGWSECRSYSPYKEGGLRISGSLFATPEAAAQAAENIATLWGEAA